MTSRSRLAPAYYDIATMLEAGVPILRTLAIVIEGRQGRLKKVFVQIRESLSKGSSLGEAFGRHPDVFPELDRMLIEAAETSGSISAAFKMLSQWHEYVHRITRHTIMGLIYPFMVLHIAALIYRLPDLILGSLSAAGYIRSVLGVLLFLYIPTALVILAMSRKEKSPLLRLVLDSIVLRVPLLGRAIFQLSIARYAKAFGMLYSAGVPMAETAQRATRGTGNVAVARLFEGGIANIRAGGAAWEGFSKRLPLEYLHLWQIGEETGELDRTTAKIAEIATDRAELRFAAFVRWFPFMIYAVIAGVAIFMIFNLWGRIYGGLNAF